MVRAPDRSRWANQIAGRDYINRRGAENTECPARTTGFRRGQVPFFVFAFRRPKPRGSTEIKNQTLISECEETGLDENAPVLCALSASAVNQRRGRAVL